MSARPRDGDGCGSDAREVRHQCTTCGRVKPDVRYDRAALRYLCNACWFLTVPPGPGSRRAR